MGVQRMDKEWDKKACLKRWVEEEQTSIYSLAFFLTGDKPSALQLTNQAIALAYRSHLVISKALFLEAVAGSMCRLYAHKSGGRSLWPQLPKREPDVVLSLLLQLEGELRVVVLYHCLLKFDREALAKKLEWPQEKLNTKLNEALEKLQNNFLAQGLLKPN